MKKHLRQALAWTILGGLVGAFIASDPKVFIGMALMAGICFAVVWALTEVFG